MRRPVVRRDLVADQIVHRAGVGHAQQRLGEAHQRHALLGRQAVGGEEHLHQPRVGRSAHGAHEVGGTRRDRGAVGIGEIGESDQPRECGGFIGQDIGADVGTDCVERLGWHEGIPETGGQ